VVRELRASGIRAEASLDERPLKAQLRMADRAGAYFAAILGERELQEEMVTVRTMEDGSQEQVARAELVAWLNR
jgi:histidyl-tRNA synthetase